MVAHRASSWPSFQVCVKVFMSVERSMSGCVLVQLTGSFGLLEGTCCLIMTFTCAWGPGAHLIVSCWSVVTRAFYEWGPSSVGDERVFLTWTWTTERLDLSALPLQPSPPTPSQRPRQTTGVQKITVLKLLHKALHKDSLNNGKKSAQERKNGRNMQGGLPSLARCCKSNRGTNFGMLLWGWEMATTWYTAIETIETATCSEASARKTYCEMHDCFCRYANVCTNSRSLEAVAEISEKERERDEVVLFYQVHRSCWPHSVLNLVFFETVVDT